MKWGKRKILLVAIVGAVAIAWSKLGKGADCECQR